MRAFVKRAGRGHIWGMPTHSEDRLMPYPADQLYDLVADIDKYPAFLPWCSAARIRKRSPIDGGELLDAELVISFKVFREKFGSRVKLRRDEGKIDVSYLEGPFRYLDNFWEFVPLGERECRVKFYVDFEFKNRALQALIGVVFQQAMQRIVRAFEERAADLYGTNAA